jgi:hypothetical protein
MIREMSPQELPQRNRRLAAILIGWLIALFIGAVVLIIVR